MKPLYLAGNLGLVVTAKLTIMPSVPENGI
jgi:hypothetical protein